MQKLLCTLFLATLGVVAAKADTISIVFDKPSQLAVAGGTLNFTGTITNLTSSTIFFNGDFYTIAATGFTVNDQFLNNVPFSLGPGANSGDIDLFDVTSPASVPSGPTAGSYGLSGGPDFDAANNLGSGSFTIQSAVPAPEINPSFAADALLLLAGGIAVLRGRRVRLTA